MVSYVGRHNEIKGYADLKKMGEKLLNNQNTYFLIAGKEEPMDWIIHTGLRWVGRMIRIL